MRDDRQHQQPVRQRTGQRGDGEQQQSGEVDAAIADDLAERRERQQGDGDRELIAVDDPDREGRTGIEIFGDGRQRDIGDRAVHHGQHEAERDRQDRPIAPRDGQAIADFGWSGGHARTGVGIAAARLAGISKAWQGREFRSEGLSLRRAAP